MAEKCADFLETAKNQPFFLYFCPTDPHRTNPRRDLPLQPNAHGNRPNGQEGVNETLYGADSLRVPYFIPNSPKAGPNWHSITNPFLDWIRVSES